MNIFQTHQHIFNSIRDLAYDQEIEKRYHPENFEDSEEMEKISNEHQNNCSGCALCEK